MATVIQPAPPLLPAVVPAAVVWNPTLFRLTAEQYRQMVELGILAEDDLCELIHGLLVQKMPPHLPYSQATRRLNRAVTPLLTGTGMAVGVRDPVALSESQPEPDMYVAAGPDNRYTHRHPGAADLLLVLEVADPSLHDDRTVKLQRYAAEGVAQYWIVNLPDRRVEVYTAPGGPTYAVRTDYAPGQAVPVVLGGRTFGSIPVNELLP